MFGKLIEPGASIAEAREIPITKDEFLIGRGADCDLRLRVSAVSRHHCMLRIRGQDASITDLGSANGTFLNDVRVRSQASVKTGDRLGIGEYLFIVEVGTDTSGAAWGPADSDSISATVKLPSKKKPDQQA